MRKHSVYENLPCFQRHA